MNNFVSINIITNNSKICNDCDFQYDYQFNNCSKKVNQISLQKENNKLYKIFFSTLCENKLNHINFKGKSYSLNNCYITRMSTTRYNTQLASAELIMKHIVNNNSTDKNEPSVLFVSIPIIITDTNINNFGLNFNNPSSSEILSKLINLSKNLDKNKQIDTIELNEDINYNGLIPNKKYYMYESNNIINILFDKNDYAIEISQYDYNILSNVIEDSSSTFKEKNIALLISDKPPTFMGSTGVSDIFTKSLGISNSSSTYNENNTSSSASNEKSKNGNDPNWVAFGFSILTILFIMIIWSILGINILYFLIIKKEYLEKLFPTDKNKPPYSNDTFISNISNLTNFKKDSEIYNKFQNTFNKKNGLTVNKENKENFKDIMSDKQIDNIEKIIKSTKLNVYGFPYKWKETVNFLHPKYFIGNSIMNSYINGRTYVKDFFKFLSDFESSQTILFIFVPLILYLFLFIVPIISYVITFIAELNSGVFSTILYSFIFGLSFILPFIVSFIQTIHLFISLFLLPSVTNSKKIEIFEDNFVLISFIFSLLVSISAFSTLGSLFGTVITLSIAIVYGILYKIFKNSD